MESKKINNAVIGGDLGSAAAGVMATEGITNNKSNIPEDAVMINKSLLPSKGKYYKSDLYVTELSPIDLKNLNSMTEDTANQTINSVLANCIHGISYKDILQGDKVWLLFYIRSVTYDDFPIFVKYSCPSCKKVDTYKVRLSDLKVNYASDKFEPQFELPKSKKVLTLRYPTLRLEERAQALAKNDQIIEAVDPEMAEIALYIEKIDGQEVTPYEAYKFAKSMKAMDFVAFSNYMVQNNIGLVPIVEIPCTCGEKVNKKIGFTPDFFFPDFKKYANA